MKRDVIIERLQRLQEAPAPFLSLTLETRADSELGPQKIATRWRDLRREASDQIPEKALLLLDDVVGGAHRDGRGLVAVTSGEEILYRRHLPDEIGDGIRIGSLPHLLPFFDWIQHHPAYAVVIADRTGGEIHVVGSWGDEETVEVEGDHDEIRKVNAGGWSQRRFQNRAEDSWEQNAEEVAERLTQIMRAEALKLAVVLGDVRARAFLREHAPSDIAPLLFELDVDPNYRDDLENVRGEIEAAVAGLIARRIDQTLERFQEERGQEDLAADGLEPTMAALRMAQVETLLLRSSGLEEPAWFSPSDMTQGATRRGTLEETGINDVAQASTDEVLVRLALGTGAAVCVIPQLGEEHGPTGGVGAILRYRSDRPAG
jgi:peptide subunit release factor 1 (eRF1)